MIIHTDYEKPNACGNIYVSTVTELAWVYIPKCGTSTMKELGWQLDPKNGWCIQNAFRKPKYRDKKRLVTLRDPVERWRAGMGEVLLPKWKKKSGHSIERLRQYYDSIDRFSGTTNHHLNPQALYCEGVDTDNAIFIRLEELDEKLPLVIPEVKEVPHLRRSDDPEKKEVMEFIDKQMELHGKEIENCIRDRYKCDYDLIAFFGRE